MEYKATAKYLKISPRKVRLLADAIRGMNVTAVMGKLQTMHQHAAKPITSVIRSAIAGAKEKQATEHTLRLKVIEVMEGPAFKRFRAVSRGMAHSYKKRVTHIRVILADEESKPEVKKQEPKAKK